MKAGATLALACWLSGFAGTAEAKIYKCKDADGAIVFSDKGCDREPTAEARPQATVDVARQSLPKIALPAPESPSESQSEAQPSAAAAVIIQDLTPAQDALTAGVRTVDPVSLSRAPRAGEQREPLRPRKTDTANWWLICIGLAGLLLAYILHIVSAFGIGATGWGVALILLSPLSNLAFTLRHFREARVGFALGAASTAVCALLYVPAVDLIEVQDSYLTARASTDLDDRRPRVTFTRAETVHLKTVLDWQDWSVARPQFVSWAWYSAEQLVDNHVMQLEFTQSPFVLLGDMPAAKLGPGQHRVEVYVNGELFDAQDFQVM